MESIQVVDAILYLATFAVIVYYIFNWVTRTGQMKRDLLSKSHKTKSGFEDISRIAQYERLEPSDKEGSGQYVPLTDPLYGPNTSVLIAESGKYAPQRTVPCPPNSLDENPIFATGYYNESENDEYGQFNTKDRKWKSGPQANTVSPALLKRITEATFKYQHATGEILAKLITKSDNRTLLSRALFNDQYPEDIIEKLDAKLKAGKPPLTETETRIHRTFYQLADPDSSIEDQLLGRLLTELDAKRKLLQVTPNNQTLKAEVMALEARLEGQPILNRISNIKEKYRVMVQDTRSSYGLNSQVDNTVSYLNTDKSLGGRMGASSQAREFYPRQRELLNPESKRRYEALRELDRKVLTKEDFEKKYAWVDLIGKNSLPPVEDPFSPQPGLSQAKADGLRSVMDILSDYDVNNYKCQRIYQECGYRESDGFPVKPMTFTAYDHYLDHELHTRSEYVRRASDIRETLMDPEMADPEMAMDMDSINSLAGSSARLTTSAEVGDGLEMIED
jgi:hypothetical protein